MREQKAPSQLSNPAWVEGLLDPEVLFPAPEVRGRREGEATTEAAPGDCGVFSRVRRQEGGEPAGKAKGLQRAGAAASLSLPEPGFPERTRP